MATQVGVGTGNTAGQPTGLPTTAPQNAIVSLGSGSNQTYVNVAATGQTPIWSNDPTAVSNAQGSASASGTSTGGTSTGGGTNTSSITDPTLSSMLSTLGGISSTITGDNAQNTAAYNQIVANDQSTQAETDTALQGEEAAAVKELQQSNQTQTEGFAQSTAMLSQYHGVNTALTQFWSDLSDKQNAAISTLQAQYQTAIANADTTMAGQIQTALLAQIQSNQQQDQDMFSNAMSLFNGMSATINNQNQTSLQQTSLSDTEKQQAVTNAQSNLTTILTSLAGDENNTWSNLDSATQSQLTTLATAAGMSPAALQQVVNSNAKEGVSTTSVPGLLGTTILTMDKAGNVINSSYMPMISPNTPQGASIISSQVNWSNSSTPGGAGYIPSSVLSSLKISGLAATAAVNGQIPGANIKVLDTNDSNKMQAYGTGLATAAQLIQQIQGDTLLPNTNTSEITGAVGRNVSSALNDKINAYMAANPGIISVLTSAAGSTSGFAIRAILSSDGSALISPNTQMPTIIEGLQQMGTIIAAQQDSIVPGYGTAQLSEYPDITGSVTPTTTAATSGGGAGGGNSGSTTDTSLIPGWNP